MGGVVLRAVKSNAFSRSPLITTKHEPPKMVDKCFSWVFLAMEKAPAVLVGAFFLYLVHRSSDWLGVESDITLRGLDVGVPHGIF